jgi:hypothetical protein
MVVLLGLESAFASFNLLRFFGFLKLVTSTYLITSKDFTSFSDPYSLNPERYFVQAGSGFIAGC